MNRKDHPMKRSWWCGLFLATAFVVGSISTTAEAGPIQRRWYAQHYSWHHDYYDPAWGPAPHALVVPPTTCRHVEYNWGVAGTENLPIRHQFQTGFNGGAMGGGYFAPAPVQPSSTNQMGVYYIRAPW
jgi:hypothetical protein